MHDEELTSRRIGCMARAMDRTPGGVLQIVGKTILCKFSFDGYRDHHTGSLRASALDHETGNDTMKDFFHRRNVCLPG